MIDKPQFSSEDADINDGEQSSGRPDHRNRSLVIKSILLLLIFGIGLASGFLIGRQSMKEAAADVAAPSKNESMTMMNQVNPPDGYQLPVTFGDIGPQMVAAGAIDMPRFIALYEQQSTPLTDDQMALLTQGTAENMVISQENAYFLLNFLWAFGLTNQNPILTDGPMMAGGADKVGSFASTAGWTLGKKGSVELYASHKMVTLTEEQQAWLLEVASEVYRPCCNNPTHFPDCNHGMAMLGLLELMASQDATSNEMFETAKYVTAFWYPQQMLEVATVFNATQNVDFARADARQVVSGQYASGTGYQGVHQWLAQNGLLEQAPNNGGSCGVQ
jgi:hypothetical protein